MGRDDGEGGEGAGSGGGDGGGFRTAGGGWTGFALTEGGGVGTDEAAGRFFRTATRGVGSEAFCGGMTSPSSVSSTTAGIVNVFILIQDQSKREELSSFSA